MCQLLRRAFLLFALGALAACNLVGARITPSPTPELPTVEFLFPANGATVVENAELTVDLVARDAGAGIARIEFLVDGQKLSDALPQDGATVPVFRIETNWLAQGVGLHSLSAVAYRLDGTSSTETIVIVEVVASE